MAKRAAKPKPKPKAKAEAKPKAKAKSKPKTKVAREWSPAQLAVQEAGRITGDLRCNLQRVRKAFLVIGQLLCEVRDRKLYEPLHDADLEAYAAHRLDMSKPTMYRYIKVYEWVLANHKEWLEPGAKIPSLTGVGGLVWIDQELAKKELKPGRKATLDALKKKAEAGKMTARELATVQQRTNKPKSVTVRILASLRVLLKQANRNGATDRLKAAIEQAIRVAENDLAVETAGLHLIDVPGNRRLQLFLSRNTMLA